MHRSLVRFIGAAAPLAAVIAFTPVARAAAIPISGGYTQNFNTLPTSSGSWAQDSTLPGWSAYFVTSGAASGGTATDANALIASAGGSATAGIYSWGAVGNADRALGSIASNSLPGSQVTGNARPSIYYVLHLINNTGSDIASVAVSYSGEQWRAADTQASTHELTFQYYVGASPDFGKAPGYGGWSSDVDALTFTATQTNTGSAGVAGTTAPLVATPLTATLPVSLAAGSDLYLRWRDVNDSGNDHGVGLDNLSVSYTLVPEPAAASMLLLAGLPTAARRRGSRR